MTLDEVADELYSLPPEQFTAARTAREKEARQGGDRELAASIRLLGKPTVAAWLANQLAREREDQLQAIPALGAGLRRATEELDGEALRRLSREQRQLVSTLVQQAQQIAAVSGHRVSESAARDLEDTLHAAVADQGACEQLFTGRLTEPLERSGFGGWPAIGGSVAMKNRTSKTSPASAPRQSRRDDEQVQAADRALAEAEQTLAEAASALAEAESRSAEVDDAAEAAAAEVDRLRLELDAAVVAAKDAEGARRQQVKNLGEARDAVDEAERRRATAQGHRDAMRLKEV